jgi:Uncharacterized protein conserved in bacteria (DUF2252)
MLVSPFTFYRGAAYLMASDLASAPRTGLSVQLCGDAHLSNFGGLRRPGPAAGLQRQRLRRDATRPVRVGHREVGGQLRRRRTRFGFDTKRRKSINLAVARSYREAMLDMAQMKKLDVWYARLDIDEMNALVSAQMKPKTVKQFD